MLSIITINLNNLKGLTNTYNSLFRVIGSNVEFIVVDGGSSDGSKEFIRENEECISKWISEPDFGIYDAMNKGVKMAEGEYCLFLNSGDILFSDKILFDILPYCNGKNHIISGSLKMGTSNVWEVPEKINFFHFLESTLPHQSTVVKKSLLLKYPYNVNLKIVGDWAFFLKAFKNEEIINFVKLDLVIAIFDTTGISSLPENQRAIMNEKNKVIIDELGLGLSVTLNNVKNCHSKLRGFHVNHLIKISENKISVKVVNGILSLLSRFRLF
jgi:glycosyltransferase involved in cell wall biosynthesis